MFVCGQLVMYGSHGVCKIVDIESRIVDRKKAEYLVLEPGDHPGARYLVPMHSPVAMAKLQRLLTKEELLQLLRSNETTANCWINEENQRKHRYRELINSGDRVAIIAMVRTLRKHKVEQIAAGRKFHLCDENFLKDALRLLSSEFTIVLEISASEVESYLDIT